jgi:hypothetical protein
MSTKYIVGTGYEEIYFNQKFQHCDFILDDDNFYNNFIYLYYNDMAKYTHAKSS